MSACRPSRAKPAKARAFRIAAWAVLIGGGVIAIATGLDLLLIVPAVPRLPAVFVARSDTRWPLAKRRWLGMPRAPILYLRSFMDEEAAEGAFHRFGKFGVPHERWLAQSTPCNSRAGARRAGTYSAGSARTSH